MQRLGFGVTIGILLKHVQVVGRTTLQALWDFASSPKCVTVGKISLEYSPGALQASRSRSVLSIGLWIVPTRRSRFAPHRSEDELTDSVEKAYLHASPWIRVVPITKLLLETDSPHLLLRGSDKVSSASNTPPYLGKVVSLVADVRRL